MQLLLVIVGLLEFKVNMARIMLTKIDYYGIFIFLINGDKK